MKQLQAGFILDRLDNLFEGDSYKQNAFKNLTKWCSYFTFESIGRLKKIETNYSSNVAILINLIERGAPTLLNKYALDAIVEKSELLSFDKYNDSEVVLQYSEAHKEIKDLFFRSFHLIDPRTKIKDLKETYEQSWEKLDSKYEENFIFDALPKSMKSEGPVLSQLLASQRTITSIIKDSFEQEVFNSKSKNNFEQQRTDFSIEFPYASNDKKGIIIEIDGPQHNMGKQRILDDERDRVVIESGWNNTLRIKTSEFGTSNFKSKIEKILKPALQNDFIDNCVNNFNNPIWETEIGKEVLQISLIPFAIARIQRVLLEMIANKTLDLKAKKWSIVVLERDVPCAKLAIDDFIKTIDTLSPLSKTPLALPKIELKVFSTTEFLESKFQFAKPGLIDYFKTPTKQDLIIDISILESNNTKYKLPYKSKEIVTIRSIKYIDTVRKVATNGLINYEPFCKSSDNIKWSIENEKIKFSLEYLLQSLFRKKRFREGQLPIIHNSLQCKSVIGLLPTGGGKSLTYQLSALLQPGICIIIDPIRSLMKDQVDGLNRNYIDSCIYVNSTLKGKEKQSAMKKIAAGEAQFVFISPERLQMEEFRALLNNMYKEKIFFSYCVIDEVHCVSEWGHDFRTAYLRLGENAQKYCKTKDDVNIPLFGLTATASYDVLADVQRELSGNDETKRLPDDSIIRSEYSKRDELQYVIKSIHFPEYNLRSIWDLKSELSDIKKAETKKILLELPKTINNLMENPLSIFSESKWKENLNNEHDTFSKIKIDGYSDSTFKLYDKNGALVFCPHTKGRFGVTDKFTNTPSTGHNGFYDYLSYLSVMKAGFFMGSSSDSDITGRGIELESSDNQDKFINDELNLMVATKAFGMGIDKDNIRCTIHVNYPSSIESYVQEAGRAGRDKKIAISYILFNDQVVDLPTEKKPIDHDFDINMYFHNNSFKGEAKELAVLDEILTEIYFPNKINEIENLINSTFDIDIKCDYWNKGYHHRLYIDYDFTKRLGYFDLSSLNGYLDKTVDVELSNKIFSTISNYIKSLNLTVSPYVWIQKTNKKSGIEKLLENIEVGNSSEITIGFRNDTKERIATITKWLQIVVHKRFDEQTIQRMRASSTEAEFFIEEVCENYKRFTGVKEFDFKEHCRKRDINKGNPNGTAFNSFINIYNGYRDKIDTERAIFRLSTLGIIDDYTVNFLSNTFTIKIVKKEDTEYIENLKKHLLKYYSVKTTEAKLKKLEGIDEPTTIRKTLSFLVNFVYNEIRKKRLLALKDMQTACRIGLEKGSVELKDYIDLYFNSKYARTGYSYTDENGEDVSASLADITDNGKNDSIKWVWDFMKIVDEDPKAGQIDNIKHLRGACTRMLNNQPDNYTLLLLNAFSIYMLEYKNHKYLDEANNLVLDALINIIEKENDIGGDEIYNIYNEFIRNIIDKNEELEKHLKAKDNSISNLSDLIKLIKPLGHLNSLLSDINNKLK